MNYAEELAYWYLRLNGFFLLTDWVLHQSEPGAPRTADIDLLALRHPHVRESVGGQEDDIDPILKRWIPIGEKIVGLIVEVKSGSFDDAAVARASRQERTSASISRLGLMPAGESDALAEVLGRDGVWSNDTITIARLFIASQQLIDQRHQDLATWKCVNMAQIDEFIRGRLDRNARRKAMDRLFFPGNLMQYLAWRALAAAGNELA